MACRCVRLGLNCIEQMRAQGRPVSLWDEATYSDEAPTARSSPFRKRRHSAQAHGKPAARHRRTVELTPLLIHTAADVLASRFTFLQSKKKAEPRKAEAVM
jgi:hypothetical protein